MPSGFLSPVPAKTTPPPPGPLRLLADCSPSTQQMASLMLDLPHPLGPTMAATPSPLKRSSVRSQNDLNPCISTRLSFSKVLSSAPGECCNYTKLVEAKSKACSPHYRGSH